MNINIPATLAALAVLSSLISCRVTSISPPVDEPEKEFGAVKLLLESNCVHCHGQARLPHMPPMDSTVSLATFIGKGRLIVPHHPESSRLMTVVTLCDHQAGAMPPTGHAISFDQQVALYRWIQDGAKLPKSVETFSPKGAPPRS